MFILNIIYFYCFKSLFHFQGQELNDQTQIANYDLGKNSIINVVRITEKLTSSKQANLFQSALLLSTNSESVIHEDKDRERIEEEDFVYLNKDEIDSINNLSDVVTESLEDTSIDDLIKNSNFKQLKSNFVKLSEDKRSYFFVYCSAKSCRKITTGKLRVRCFTCKEHSLIVEQHPNDWSDVLIEERIKGKCQNIINNHPCKGIYAQFYFKCSSAEHKNDENDENINVDNVSIKNELQLDENALPLESIKHNSRLTKCPICDEIKETIFVFKCGHSICLDCFVMYCESKLNSRDLILIDKIGYTTNCVFDCTDSFIEDTHYFHVLANRDYERYQDFGAEEYVLKNGVICPQPNCSQGMLIDDKKDTCTKICCISCNYLFCSKCKGEYHEGECSKDIILESIKTNSAAPKSFGQILKDKIAAFSWNRSEEIDDIIIKRCPNTNCNCPTERDAGCLHITCKMCGLNWVKTFEFSTIFLQFFVLLNELNSNFLKIYF